MNFDNYKFRASSLGKIISKSGKMTIGVQTYLQECFIEQVYGVKKEIYGKALEKGIATEEEGFSMLQRVFYPDTFVAKIKESKQNDWIKGTPDCIVENTVTDIKNAWDLFTFGKAHMNYDYYWQLKAYMMLYDLNQGRLFYCLNNLPEYMLMDEQRKMFYTQRKWATMESEEYLEACEELEKAHNYDHMPIEHKFKFWNLQRTDEDDETIIKSVIEARKFMNELYEQHLNNIETNKTVMNLINV